MLSNSAWADDARMLLGEDDASYTPSLTNAIAAFSGIKETARRHLIEDKAGTTQQVKDDEGIPIIARRESYCPSAESNDYTSSVQLDCLAAVAYMLGSPLQRQQPSVVSAVQPSLVAAAQLLERGVDPERVVQLIQSNHNTQSYN